jgi:DNA-binding transcriptional ArsR family regulator
MSRSPEPPEVPLQPRLDEVELMFGALAHAARRQIVMMLAHLGGELPSGYLAKRLAASWPTTTRHLHVLEAAGVIAVRREGRGSYYRLDRDRVRRVLGTWLALLEPPTPTRTWRSRGPTSVLATPQRKGKRS